MLMTGLCCPQLHQENSQVSAKTQEHVLPLGEPCKSHGCWSKSNCCTILHFATTRLEFTLQQSKNIMCFGHLVHFLCSASKLHLVAPSLQLVACCQTNSNQAQMKHKIMREQKNLFHHQSQLTKHVILISSQFMHSNLQLFNSTTSENGHCQICVSLLLC